MNSLQILLLQKTQNNRIKPTKILIENINKKRKQSVDVIAYLKIAKEKFPKTQIPDKKDLRNMKTLCNKIIKECKKRRIAIIDIFSKKYPKKLYALDNPPILIFAKGNMRSLVSNRIVAIIGTRHPSEYGFKVARKIAQYCTRKGFVVISGLALGCDTQGHLGCLDENGQTIAVLPTQIENISPKANQGLADNIVAKKGCLISEYDSSIKLGKWTFVHRDRLIAALADAIIVIETSEKGGTMHTVDCAVRLRRPIACVYGFPKSGHNNDPEGNVKLIQNKIAVGIKDRRELESYLSSITRITRACQKNSGE